MTVAEQVGRALHGLRQAAGLSLSELARRSGVGKATLSELEAGRRNPTLDTLYALTTTLNVPLSAALPSPDDLSDAPRVVSGEAVDAILTTRFTAATTTVEIYRITIRPGRPQHSAAHVTGTTEHLIVLAGTARAGSGPRPPTILAGQSHTWTADVPHSYAAAGAEPVDALLVMQYPLHGDLSHR
jgi:transcriptional regulator with XRE-family HTH domain